MNLPPAPIRIAEGNADNVGLSLLQRLGWVRPRHSECLNQNRHDNHGNHYRKCRYVDCRRVVCR